MKKLIFFFSILCVCAMSANALVLKTAEPIGAERTGFEIESSSPMAHAKHTEVSGKLTYGINNSLDIYGSAAKQTLPGSSYLVFGAGLKGNILNVSGGALVDLAWIGDLSLSQSQTTEMFEAGLIAGFIFGRSFGPVTPYGLLGLSTYYGVAGSGVSTQKSSVGVGAGIAIALGSNLRLKAEGLYSNIYQGAEKSAAGFAVEIII